MQYIIGFNGPPKCGKDSVAQALRTLIDNEHSLPTHLDHLARPMRQVAMTMWGLDPNDFELYGKVKDEPNPTFADMSLREFMIDFSEKFIKSRFGSGFWGEKLLLDHKWLAHPSHIMPGILLVPDIGFYSEIKVFDDAIGADNVLIVQMDRPNIGWANDSRSYCSHLSKVMCLTNDQSIQAAAVSVLDCVKQLGWSL